MCGHLLATLTEGQIERQRNKFASIRKRRHRGWEREEWRVLWGVGCKGHALLTKSANCVLGKLCWVFRFDAPFALFAISLDDKVDIVNLANFLYFFFDFFFSSPHPHLAVSPSLPLLSRSPLGGECFDCVGYPLDFSSRFDCIMSGADYKSSWVSFGWGGDAFTM